MDMPGYLDYGKMMEMNPMAYQQASDQLSLAKQFQAEKQKQAEATTLEGMLKNEQSRSMNPMLLEQQSQTNAGRATTNASQGLDFERKQASHVANLTADQRAAAIKLTDDDFKEADQHIEKMLRSGDPQQIEQAMKAQQYLPALLAEKRKHEQQMEKTRYEQQQETGRAVERNETSRYVADRSAEASAARTAARGGGNSPDFWSSYYKVKGARNQHSALIAEANKIGPDDPTYPVLVRMAEAIRPQAEAEIASVKPGSINTGELAGVPTNAGPAIAPKAPTGPKPVAPAGRVVIYKDGKPVGSVPTGQLQEALKQGYTQQ